MCTSNHPGSSMPGYMVDTPVTSIASRGALFTRLLAHHNEVGLTYEQITGSLDVSGEYHQRYNELSYEFAKVTEALEIKWRRIDNDAISPREELLKKHAQLFLDHEYLFFEMTKKGHDLLSDEQIERAEMIYHTEKEEMLEALLPALNHAVGPNFGFTGVKNSANISGLAFAL